MILQKIILPFDAGTADTIYTKQGETGRGIWFDFPFDTPADELENYKCEFIAIKPDDTFVIEDAGLSTHGEGEGGDIVYHTIAQLTLPEQVSAAKGTGSYILKVYDYVHDNDLIYSAAGGLYVDDHLLLDSMIESIAQVNGYNFPDDFLTSADLLELIDDSIIAEDATWSSHKIDEEITDAAAALQEDIDGLLDDNATSADTTWSSQKISDELGNIDTGHHYSTTEHEVGIWIDGSTIYEKTIEVTLPNSTGDTMFPVSTPGLTKVITWDMCNRTKGRPAYIYCPWSPIAETIIEAISDTEVWIYLRGTYNAGDVMAITITYLK